MNRRLFSRIEWPTVLLIAACYSAWFGLAFAGGNLPVIVWIVGLGLLTTLYWSIVHEVIHGHPTPWKSVNFALAWLPLGWVYSICRFRDGHLEHHATGALTDPFDDPESWYLDPKDWGRMGWAMQAVLNFNNTLFGRMLIGPIITFLRMVEGDVRLAMQGGETRRKVFSAWALHVPAIAILAGLLAAFSPVSAWQFAAAAYLGISVLLIRTYAEHQASEQHGARTVIIENGGLLGFLFLYNNLHVVHHTRPGLAWYLLPAFYDRHRARFIRRNHGYIYKNYWQLFRSHFLRAKEPVPHPLAG